MEDTQPVRICARFAYRHALSPHALREHLHFRAERAAVKLDCLQLLMRPAIVVEEAFTRCTPVNAPYAVGAGEKDSRRPNPKWL